MVNTDSNGIDIEEKLIRQVSLVGNGAHVFVPREWAGEDVILVRKPKKELKEKILDILKLHLEYVEGVFLFGSYARGEEKEDSDIDLFVISNKKIKIKAEGFEIICIEKNKFEKAIKIEPVIIYSMLNEARAIINAGLLEKLKDKYKPRRKEFMEFLEDSERIIKINEEFLEEEGGEEYIQDSAISYSLILRLRGVFIIRCLLSGKKYSFISFKKWIENNVRETDFELVYNAYERLKRDRNITVKINVRYLIELLKFLKKEVYRLKDGKKKKEASERD